MKHAKLRAVAHNYADSLASGLGFVVGFFPTSVFADAAVQPDGMLVVDFLNGRVAGGFVSDELTAAMPLYRNAFPDFCAGHGCDVGDFRRFLVRFRAGRTSNGYTVTIEDARGKVSTLDYAGTPGRRVRQRDSLGRVRPRPAEDPVEWPQG